MRILIVDDDPYMREAVAALFLHHGLSSVTAGSVSSGWREAQREKPDLVISDIDMGDGTGFDLADLLSTLDNPPNIYFMSGYVSNWKARAAADRGRPIYNKKDIQQVVEELVTI